VTLRRFLLSALLLLAASLGASPGRAAGPLAMPAPGTEKGLALARAWCANCHAVESGDTAPFADIPTFAAVARQPSTTAPALHAFLSTPHGDMPDIKLKSDELDAIVAYILSLKGKSATN
jgi:mono/diheme cytochrome c family protein